MGLFNRMSLRKIKRDEVVDALAELHKRQDALICMKDENNKKIEKLFQEGCRAKDKDEQLFCAKQINLLKAENKSTMNRLIYLTNNISMLNQLKTALDEKDFIKVNKKMNLGKLIDNPADLAKFMKSLNNDKMMNEQKLANTLDAMEDVSFSYEENERLFGETESDNKLLAMFEYSNITEPSMTPDMSLFAKTVIEENEEDKNSKTKRRVLTDV